MLGYPGCGIRNIPQLSPVLLYKNDRRKILCPVQFFNHQDDTQYGHSSAYVYACDIQLQGLHILGVSPHRLYDRPQLSPDAYNSKQAYEKITSKSSV